jgi:hypothetical protein
MGNAQNLSLDDAEPLPLSDPEVMKTKKSLIHGVPPPQNEESDVIYSTLDDGSSVSRRRTETESVVVKRKSVVHDIMLRS